MTEIQDIAGYAHGELLALAALLQPYGGERMDKACAKLVASVQIKGMATQVLAWADEIEALNDQP